MRYLKGLAFDSEFVPVVPRIGRGARPSEAFVDLTSVEAKLDELQEQQRSMIAYMTEMKTSFAAGFSAVIAAIESFRPSARPSTDVGVGGDVESSSDVSLLNYYFLFICVHLFVFCFF